MLITPIEDLQHPELLPDTRPAHLARRSSQRRADRLRSRIRQRNVSDVLASLTVSGVIKAAWAGNERHFTAHRERWALLLDLAEPGIPSFVSWVHLLPAALQIIMWQDASQARSLMNRLSRDLEAAGIDIQHRQPAHGTAYLPVFAESGKAILARLGVAH